jgi:hypothetical protein
MKYDMAKGMQTGGSHRSSVSWLEAHLASWLMQAGAPAYAIQALGAWVSPKMVERYAHLSPEHLKQYAALPSLKA